MGAYMYPIIIKREPQIISVRKTIELDDSTLTLAQLMRYGVTNDCKFQIVEDSYSGEYRLYIYSKRLETQKEVDKRVAKEESYMKNYNNFHKNKKSK